MRYFFDFEVNGVLTADQEGLEFADHRAMRAEVNRTLMTIAHEEVSASRAPDLSVMVRTLHGPVYRACVNFECAE